MFQPFPDGYDFYKWLKVDNIYALCRRCWLNGYDGYLYAHFRDLKFEICLPSWKGLNIDFGQQMWSYFQYDNASKLLVWTWTLIGFRFKKKENRQPHIQVEIFNFPTLSFACYESARWTSSPQCTKQRRSSQELGYL